MSELYNEAPVFENFYKRALNNHIFCNYNFTKYIAGNVHPFDAIKEFNVKPNYHIHLIYSKVNPSLTDGSTDKFVDKVLDAGAKVFIHYRRNNDFLESIITNFESKCKVMGFPINRRFIFRCSPFICHGELSFQCNSRINLNHVYGDQHTQYLVIGSSDIPQISMFDSYFVVDNAEYNLYKTIYLNGSLERYFNIYFERLLKDSNKE